MFSRTHFLALVWLTGCLIPTARADDDAQQKLDEIRIQYQTELNNLRDQLTDALRAAQKKAKARNEQITNRQIEAEIGAFETSGLLPSALPDEVRAYLQQVGALQQKYLEQLKIEQRSSESLKDPKASAALRREIAAVTNAARQPNWIGLLNSAQPERGSGRGGWTKSGEAFSVSGQATGSVLDIPFTLRNGEEYELQFTIARTAGSGGVVIGFPVNGARAMLAIETEPGATSGVNQVGSAAAASKSNSSRARLFRDKSPLQVSLVVRQQRVSARTSNGYLIGDWQGDPSELALPAEYAKIKPQLFVVAQPGVTLQLTRLNLRFVDEDSAPVTISRAGDTPSNRTNEPAATGPLAIGETWQGFTRSSINGNANTNCSLRVVKADGATRVLRLHHDNDRSEIDLYCILNGTGLALTDLKPVRGKDHGAGGTVLTFAGGGQLQGRALQLQFSYRFSTPMSLSCCNPSGVVNQLASETVSVSLAGK